jgi:hypothetical protein
VIEFLLTDQNGTAIALPLKLEASIDICATNVEAAFLEWFEVQTLT